MIISSASGALKCIIHLHDDGPYTMSSRSLVSTQCILTNTIKALHHKLPQALNEPVESHDVVRKSDYSSETNWREHLGVSKDSLQY